MITPVLMLLCLVLGSLCLVFIFLGGRPRRRRFHRRARARVARGHARPTASRDPKPEWARLQVLCWHEQTGLSHRKLADKFNRVHFADTGVSVGRTWVREQIKQQAYRALHAQRQLKRRVPPVRPNNAELGFDTTMLRDAGSQAHIVVGLVDHGSRLNLLLRVLPRFNTWTLLGAIFLAIGEHGKPAAIRLDNHPVHHAKRFKTVMRWLGIRLRFSQPASPWQNGRIERFFGTLKSYLQGLCFLDAGHVVYGLAEFSHYYNHVRGHQHLGGRTPAEVWHGVNPYRRAPRRCLWFEGWGGRLRGWQLQH